MIKTNESAVSPVVGVMLMLVVVIIIAAVVSAFAGGLVSTNNKAPQATIHGKYSYSSGIFQMIHAGGDELPTQKLIVQIYQNDEDFGGYGGMFKGAHVVANKSFICNSAAKCWLNADAGTMTDVPVWCPGESMYYNQSLTFETEDVIGKSVFLEIDTIDGKLISKSKVLIDP